ncbi:AAA family ATPase [Glaciimonas sp. GG7]
MASLQETQLRALLAARKLEPFIGHIRFPQYKNLAANTVVEFTYPITALVGANGTNKTSILRALYGAPGFNNLGNFWFSTSIDPIEETGERANCFIYGYWNATEKKIVEVIKARIKKDKDPDYWEPSRPLISYGMEPLKKIAVGQSVPEGRSKTRWNAIKKNVVYLDFRAALSAYDKFFYHGELSSKPNTEKNKKDFVRVRAPHLKRVLDDCLTAFMYRKSDRIIEEDNRSLSAEEIKEISRILDRKYDEIKLVRHTFFNCDAYTCQMRVSGLRYTEAFAGSGEFAVVRIVTSVLQAQDQSLILLDEPEVSLHPGAQDRLIDFLSSCVKKHHHQVVISTHSPAVVRKLPADAIKVLSMNSTSGKVVLSSQSALPEEAFFHLGEPVSDKITVLVEDILAAEIVRRSLIPAGEAAANIFDIRYYPGGSQTLWSHYLPIYAGENRKRLFVLFDGDKRPTQEMPDPATISSAEVTMLKTEIKRVSDADIEFHSDGGSGGGNVEQQNDMRRNFMSWVRSHVSYLPGCQIPEEFVWANMEADATTNAIVAGDAKAKFEALARQELGLASYQRIDSNGILGTQRRRLATIDANHQDLALLKKQLLDFATTAGISLT